MTSDKNGVQIDPQLSVITFPKFRDSLTGNQLTKSLTHSLQMGMKPKDLKDLNKMYSVGQRQSKI